MDSKQFTPDEEIFRFGDLLFCLSYAFKEVYIIEIRINKAGERVLETLTTLSLDEAKFFANRTLIFLNELEKSANIPVEFEEEDEE